MNCEHFISTSGLCLNYSVIDDSFISNSILVYCGEECTQECPILHNLNFLEANSLSSNNEYVPPAPNKGDNK